MGWRPLRLRDSVLVFNRDCRMQFICTMELRVLEFDVSPFVIELIPLLDGSNSVERIESILEGSAGFSRTSLENVLAIMEAERLLDLYPRQEHSEASRFERQERLLHEFASTFSLANSPTRLQEKLRTSKVVVVGVGGTGTWLLQSLVAAGIGRVDARVPHIVGGAYGGNLGVPGTSIIPGHTVCWQCIRSQTMNDHNRAGFLPLKGRTRSGGSTAAISGLVANLAAWEAMRILLGLPLALSGQVRELDLFTLEWRVRKLRCLPDCSCAALQ